MEKLKCEYPGCNKEGLWMQAFKLVNEEGASVELPFCKYHHLIVMGNHFKAKINRTPAIPPTKKEPKGTPERIDFKLIGPLKEVEIIEQVIAAIDMLKILKSDNKK